MTSWDTISAEEESFGADRVKRARRRYVIQTSPKTWIVPGDPKLSDTYEQYDITLPPNERKYICSCYSHAGGQFRRRKACSHVMAVILFKRGKLDGEIQDKGETDTQSSLAFDLDTDSASDEDEDEGARVDNRQEGSPSSSSSDTPPPAPSPLRLAVDAAEPQKLTNNHLTPDNPLFGLPPIPAKFTEFRPHQWPAIIETINLLESGVKVVMISAPTGSGKTIIGEAVRRLYANRTPTTYACTTKSLQDQILSDFDYAKVLKGRSNYPTLDDPSITAEDCVVKKATLPACNKCPGSSGAGLSWVGDDWDDEQNNSETKHCFFCHPANKCPYAEAKLEALTAPLAVLNMAYLLAETNSHRSSFTGRRLAIIDEADTIEQQLMNHIEVEISARIRAEIGIKTLPKKTIESDWIRWIRDEVIPAIEKTLFEVRGQQSFEFGAPNTKKNRAIQRLTRLNDKLAWLLHSDNELDADTNIESGWVFTGYESGDRDDTTTLRFRPIRVDRYAQTFLWSHAQQFILMSATLISPEQMAADLGLEDHEWAVVNVESTFPIERRPIYLKPAASMTFKNKDEAWPKMAHAMDEIINSHPNERVLVHTVSYGLTGFLFEKSSSDRLMTYRRAWDRDKVLGQFLDTENGVLLAPSFDRGIDLPQEECRVIIIAKVPYPSLGDKVTKARMYSHGGRTWYAVETIRSVAQMTGRAMRSADDFCETYILDGQFNRLYRENKRLFPKWWREAVIANVYDPKTRELVEKIEEAKEGL